MDSSSDIAAALGSVAGFLDRVGGLPPDVAAGAEAIAARARATASRIASDADDLLVVLVGPTGAGKSTLLNALADRPVTPVGVLRPTTSTPVVWTASGRAERYRRSGVGGVDRVEVVRSDDPLVADLTFVDAPDPDSMERSHAEALSALVTVADLVIAVTTPARYGDAIPWDLLARAQRLGSIGWVVMNRVRDDLEGRLQVGHLVARATAAGFDVAADQVVRLPERPGTGIGHPDVEDLADVLVEVGREDSVLVKEHARLRAAADVGADAREWLDAVDELVSGAGRLARTAAATSSAERLTLADDLGADPPGRAAHGATMLRLRSGASDTQEAVERLVDAAGADLVARFGLDPDAAGRILEDAFDGSAPERRLELLLGTADDADLAAFRLRLAGGLVEGVEAVVPDLPSGLGRAVEHLWHLVGDRVPA